jgi:prepilin-type N-terminal cleavage/methylation domain-containing protein
LEIGSLTKLFTQQFMRKRGFSFLELIMVIMITGILFAAGVPTYINSLSSYRAMITIKRIAADLEYAQAVARRTNTSLTINFSTANSNYTLIGVTNISSRAGTTYIVEVDDEPYYGVIHSVSFNGNGATDAEDSVIIFDRFGIPDSGGTLVIKCGSYQKQLTVDAATGQVTTQ